MKARHLLVIAFAAALCVALAGVDGARAGDLPKVEWKLSHTGVPSHPYHISSEAFANYVKEKTDGKFIVKIYHSSTLGWETDVLDAMQLGTIEMTWAAIGPYAEYAPAYDAFNLPFVFESADHMRNTFAKMDLSRLSRQALDSGLVDLSFAGFSFRHPINNVRQIYKPEDFAGIKFRTMGVPVHIDSYKAFGANVVTTAFSELYSAMQMGVVDGCENSYASLENRKFFEVAKYVTTLPILNNLCVLAASKIAFDKLPPEYQQIVREAAQVAADASNVAQEELDNAAIEIMKANGNEFHEPDIAPFVAATKEVRDQYLAKMEPWVKDMVEEIAKYK